MTNDQIPMVVAALGAAFDQMDARSASAIGHWLIGHWSFRQGVRRAPGGRGWPAGPGRQPADPPRPPQPGWGSPPTSPPIVPPPRAPPRRGPPPRRGARPPPRRLYRDGVPVGDPELGGRFRVDLPPSLPGARGAPRRDLGEPWL